MENDQAFRRGRIRWEKSQKIYQDNLAKREVNKQKRKQVTDQRGKQNTENLIEEKPTPGVKFNTDVEGKRFNISGFEKRKVPTTISLRFAIFAKILENLFKS